MRRWLVAGVALVTLYVGSYVAFRQAHVETWERDGRRYVIVPTAARLLYYFYRPVMYVDQAATGMRFHIGPHR